MIRLLHEHVIVQMDEDESVSEGGILLPEKATVMDGGLIWGTVLQVGPGKLTRKGVRIPSELEEGDRVLFCRYYREVQTKKAMQSLMDDMYGPRSIMIEEKDIVCVQEKEAEPVG